MTKSFDELKPETQRIIQIIQQIPAGQVMSYRDIGLKAGLPNGARQVARILHGLSEKHQLPWWRVIRSDARIGLTGAGKAEQIRLLRLEDIEVSDTGRVSIPNNK